MENDLNKSDIKCLLMCAFLEIKLKERSEISYFNDV